MWVVRAGSCHCVRVLAVVRVNQEEAEQECDSILREFGRKKERLWFCIDWICGVLIDVSLLQLHVAAVTCRVIEHIRV